MKYNELILSKQRLSHRKGRGISAGRGKTGGRGTKGQGSRKSGGVRPGFEGGQLPLYMRLPHLRGFRSRKVASEVVYTGQLDSIKKAGIDNQTLFDAGLIGSPYTNVKLLIKDGVTTKKDVKLQSASKKAVDALQKSGGSFTSTARSGRPSTKKTV